MRQLTKKQMCEYIKDRIERITSPVAYQYGYETKESAYNKLTELNLLNRTFGLGMDEEIEKAKAPYVEFFKNLYEESKRKRNQHTIITKTCVYGV